MLSGKHLSMASFGANLRREREMRGVSLEEIAAATKISIRCLQALEADEFSKLPGGIFRRSFIRAYANYLGLHEDTVMAEFQAIASHFQEVDLSRLSPSTPKPPRESYRTPMLALVVALAILGGGYAVFRDWRPANESQRPMPSENRLSGAPEPVAAQSTGSTAPSMETRANSTAPATTADSGKNSVTSASADVSGSPQVAGASTPAGPIRGQSESGLLLQIAATEQTWVAVDVDGKTALQGVIKPNQIQTFSAKNSFDVMTGNAQGIILTLNGETLRPLGRHGEIRKVHLTHNDLK